MEQQIAKQEIASQPTAKQPAATTLDFISDGIPVSVDFADITHITRYQKFTKVYTTYISYTTSCNLGQLMARLPAKDFLKVAPQHIISYLYFHQLPATIPVRRFHLRKILKWHRDKLNSRYDTMLAPARKTKPQTKKPKRTNTSRPTTTL